MLQHTGKRILFLSVSAGAGHVRAAEALRVAAIARASGIVAAHLDVMNFVPNTFRKIYSDLYVSLVTKYPLLWAYLYQTSNAAEPTKPMQRIRRLVERLNSAALLKAIAEHRPDAIVCTHFLPAELLSREIAKNRLHCPVWVQVTDFDLHRMWVVPHMRGYFVANTEVAYRLNAHGVAKELVHVTGIPLMASFASPLNRNDCAREIGVDPARKTILLMGGGAGIGGLEVVAEQLLAIEGDFQLIAMAGKNAAALAKLQSLATQFPGRLIAQGYTEKIERIMGCADFAITKPGGLTTSECLAIGLPMIVNSPIPGQEERNADYLLEQGVALKAIDSVTLAFRVRQLLVSPEKLIDMRARAVAIGQANAATSVLDVVLSGT